MDFLGKFRSLPSPLRTSLDFHKHYNFQTILGSSRAPEAPSLDSLWVQDKSTTQVVWVVSCREGPRLRSNGKTQVRLALHSPSWVLLSNCIQTQRNLFFPNTSAQRRYFFRNSQKDVLGQAQVVLLLIHGLSGLFNHFTLQILFQLVVVRNLTYTGPLLSALLSPLAVFASVWRAWGIFASPSVHSSVLIH